MDKTNSAAAAAPVLVLLTLTVLQVYGQEPDEECFIAENTFNFTQGDGALQLVDYLTVNSSTDCLQSGIVVIVPDMRFNCHGSIYGWSGVVSVNSKSFKSPGQVSLHFQVWRPLPDINNTFDLVGSDLLVFDSLDLSEDAALPGVGYDTTNTSYHVFFEKEVNSSGGNDSWITFQPGDVVGYYLPYSSLQTLGLLFRNTTSTFKDSEPVRIYSVDSDVCEVFGCAKTPTLVSSVLPLLYPHYVSDVFDELEIGSGSSGTSVTCPMTHDCSYSPSCNTQRPSGDGAVQGLFVVIAVSCVLFVCAVGLGANAVTLCVMRRNIIRQKETRALLRANRLEASCPFIFNEEFNQLEESPRASTRTHHQPVLENLTSLADFLQYSMQNEDNSGSNRVSWV